MVETFKKIWKCYQFLPIHSHQLAWLSLVTEMVEGMDSPDEKPHFQMEEMFHNPQYNLDAEGIKATWEILSFQSISRSQLLKTNNLQFDSAEMKPETLKNSRWGTYDNDSLWGDERLYNASVLVDRMGHTHQFVIWFFLSYYRKKIPIYDIF